MVLLSPFTWGLAGAGPQALNAVSANNPTIRLRLDNFVNITCISHEGLVTIAGQLIALALIGLISAVATPDVASKIQV
jgi:hypothetical protein